MRVLVACSLLIALATPAGAFAQATPYRRVIPPQPKVEAPAPPPAPARQTLAPLRMTGLPTAPDSGATCRATCSKERYSCSGEDDAGECSSRWLSCLSTCRAR